MSKDLKKLIRTAAGKGVTVLILSMIFTVFMSVTALALKDGDWEYQIYDDTITITNYSGGGGVVTIPDHIDNKPVTHVKKGTFNDRLGTQGLSTTMVGKLTFPKTVKNIENIFVSETTKDRWLTEIVLPEGVEVIEQNAFSNLTGLSKLILPTTVGTIGDNAFFDCKNLSQLNIPYGVYFIGKNAFQNSGLVSIKLPETVTELGTEAFRGCRQLKKAEIGASISELASKDSNGMFADCLQLEEVSLPITLASIGAGSFDNCGALRDIMIPVYVYRIEAMAFRNCKNLKELSIPSGTLKIGAFAFQNCSSLLTLTIPDSVVEIGDNFAKDSPNVMVYCPRASKAAATCDAQKVSYTPDESVDAPIRVFYRGSWISFEKYEQNPEIINDRTLVPLRAIFETMRATVDWDQATQTVTAKRGSVEVKVTIGANEIIKNGRSIYSDVPAQIINERTMIPVRVIAEAFGADVQWNDACKAVVITEQS